MIRQAHKGRGLIVLSALLLSAFPANADIGGIGSPVQADAPVQQQQQIQEEASPYNDVGSSQRQQQDIAKYGNVPANAEILPANNAEYQRVITAMRNELTANHDANVAQTSNTPSDPAAATNSNDAVMIIRFNQQYVYFDNPLRKVVYKVAGTRPNARYELESVIPSGNNGYENEKYTKNLQNVVNVLAKYGVTGERVSSKVVVSDTLKSQEINIFVR